MTQLTMQAVEVHAPETQSCPASQSPAAAQARVHLPPTHVSPVPHWLSWVQPLAHFPATQNSAHFPPMQGLPPQLAEVVQLSTVWQSAAVVQLELGTVTTGPVQLLPKPPLPHSSSGSVPGDGDRPEGTPPAARTGRQPRCGTVPWKGSPVPSLTRHRSPGARRRPCTCSRL